MGFPTSASLQARYIIECIFTYRRIYGSPSAWEGESWAFSRLLPRADTVKHRRNETDIVQGSLVSERGVRQRV